jgi:hypothetical protein
MNRYRLRLSISPAELQRYYSGEAQMVNARSITGLRIQFPARVLRAFVTRNGVFGLFELICDEDHRFVDFLRIGD